MTKIAVGYDVGGFVTEVVNVQPVTGNRCVQLEKGGVYLMSGAAGY